MGALIDRAKLPLLWRSARVTVLTACFLAICIAPHVARLSQPSLYSDDVFRVAELRTEPISRLLARPFNEHVAPLFDIVSWSAWRFAGQRLTAAPAAFTIASIVPFWICLVVLGTLVWRESASLATALTAVAVFNLSAVHIETAWWYSASSFTWALLATLLAWLCTLGAVDGDRSGARKRANACRIGSGLFAMAAPAFSAIGLLAGPVVALRSILSFTRSDRARATATIVMPVAGTLIYLALATFLRFHTVLAESVGRNGDICGGILGTVRAPIDVLIAGLFGLPNADSWLGPRLDLVIGAIFLVGILASSVRCRIQPLSLCGLALIVGGYALTLSVRNAFGAHWLLEVQRYHLFPQLGFVLVLAALARPILSRFDTGPGRSLLAATVIAGAILGVQYRPMKLRARALVFPDQMATLQAIERLEIRCRDRGVTRAQVLSALDPVRRKWFPHEGSSVLCLLASPVESPRLDNKLVRSSLLSELALSEREALCGGLDASTYTPVAGESALSEIVTEGRIAAFAGFELRRPGAWKLTERAGYLEFEMNQAGQGGPSAVARELSIPIVGAGARLELWWTGAGSEWSECRSLRLEHEADATNPCAVALDRLPHWSPLTPERIRIVVRSPSPVTVLSPRYLR